MSSSARHAARILLAMLLLSLAPSAIADAPAPPVTALAFSPDGSALLAGSQRGVEERSWPGLEATRRLETALRHVHDLAFSPDGRLVAVAGGRPAEEGTIEVRRWPEWTLVSRVAPHEDVIHRVAWSPDSRLLACAAHDARASVHEAAIGRRLLLIVEHSRPVMAAAFTAGGDALVTAGVDLSLRVWRVPSGERVRVLENHTAAVVDLAPRPEAASAAPPVVASAGRDRTVRLWQPTIGRLVRFARLPSAPVDIEWTPDGARILAVCEDGVVRAVDPETVEVVREDRAVDGPAYSLAVHPREDAVAIGGEGGVIRKILEITR